MSQGDSSEQRDIDRLRDFVVSVPRRQGELWALKSLDRLEVRLRSVAAAQPFDEGNAKPDNWSAEDHARWWILQPECGETSKGHIEAVLAEVVGLREQLAAAESTARIEAQLANEEHERAEVAVGRLEKAQAALRRIRESQAIDARHDFYLPGDSALAVALNSLFEALLVEDVPLADEDYRRAANDMPEKLP